MKYYKNYEVRHVESHIGKFKRARHLYELDVIYGFFRLYSGKTIRQYIAIYRPEQNIVEAAWDCLRDFEVPIRRFASKHNARIVIEK